jgi:ABC-type branched-subunit amino acid transport system ATPase component
MTDSILKVDNICKSFGALKASDGISIDLKPDQADCRRVETRQRAGVFRRV